MNISMTNFWLFSMLILSVILGLSSPQLINTWMLMEMNMIIFLYVIYTDLPFSKWSSLAQYFFVQSISSVAILWGMMTITFLDMNFVLMFLLPFLILKLGSFPAHSWYVKLLSQSSWKIIFLLGTLQKLLPIFVTSMMLKTKFILLMSMLSITSGVLVQNEVLIKKMIAYSSVFNLSWMLLTPQMLTFMWAFYIYTTIMGLVCLLMKNSGVFMDETKISSPMHLSYFIIGMLRIAGIPPTMGFWLKVGVSFLMMQSLGTYLIPFSFLLMSIFLLVAYMNMSLHLLHVAEKHKIFYLNDNKFNRMKVFLVVASPTLMMGLFGPGVMVLM